VVEQLARGRGGRAERGEGERAADGDPPHARLGEGGDRRRLGVREDVDRPADRAHHRTDVLEAGEAGGVEHVGARGLERLEPRDRVGEVVPAVQVVLGAGGEHERRPGRAGGLRGRLDAGGGDVERVDGRVGPARRVLDRAAGEARRGGEADGLRDRLGRVGEAVLEVGAHRHRDRPGDRRGVGERLVAGDGVVEAAERRREAAARRRERLEPERLEQARRAEVPRVRQQERAPRAVVEVQETGHGEDPPGSRGDDRSTCPNPAGVRPPSPPGSSS
jgi:hypothetical protein